MNRKKKRLLIYGILLVFVTVSILAIDWFFFNIKVESLRYALEDEDVIASKIYEMNSEAKFSILGQIQYRNPPEWAISDDYLKYIMAQILLGKQVEHSELIRGYKNSYSWNSRAYYLVVMAFQAEGNDEQEKIVSDFIIQKIENPEPYELYADPPFQFIFLFQQWQTLPLFLRKVLEEHETAIQDRIQRGPEISAELEEKYSEKELQSPEWRQRNQQLEELDKQIEELMLDIKKASNGS